MGDGLARDASAAVFQLNRVDSIAGKPAPTEPRPVSDKHIHRHFEVIGQPTNLPNVELAFAAEQGIPVEVCYVSWDVA